MSATTTTIDVFKSLSPPSLEKSKLPPPTAVVVVVAATTDVIRFINDHVRTSSRLAHYLTTTCLTILPVAFEIYYLLIRHLANRNQNGLQQQQNWRLFWLWRRALVVLVKHLLFWEKGEVYKMQLMYLCSQSNSHLLTDWPNQKGCQKYFLFLWVGGG